MQNPRVPQFPVCFYKLTHTDAACASHYIDSLSRERFIWAFSLSQLKAHVGFILHAAAAPYKTSMFTVSACVCAFCCRSNAADAGSSWDHVAK